MSAAIRFRTTADVILVGTVEKVTEHQIEILRTGVEYRDGTCTEYDPFRTRLAKVQIVSLVVDAVTDGVNIMVDQDGLLHAFELAAMTGHRIEIRTTAINPKDFAEELCQMGAAA